DVDDPELCHPHPDVPARWPDLVDVIAYRDRVRHEILASLPDIEACASRDVMARHGRVLTMVFEHEPMHHETLLYMMREMPADEIRRPASGIRYADGNGRAPAIVEVPGGVATLGADFDDIPFGWDNEFPRLTVTVPRFTIDALPITNGQFL